jgi:acyl-CoA synthetase (AMP-forming)/AMP-acid ligase II
MPSTMMDFPLTIGHIFAHGRTLYADSEVVTCEADGARRRIQFGALADRAEQLAAALRRLGVRPGDRVATFAWNNSEHQEAYFAIPGMGAVMHTINIRLSAEQIRYIIGHAEDSVLIADASLAPVLGPVLAADGDEVKTLRHLIVYGDGDRSLLPGGHRLLRTARGRTAGLPVARGRGDLRRRDVLHQRHHRLAEGGHVQPPVRIPAHAGPVLR